MNQFSIGEDSAWAQFASPQEPEFAYVRFIWLFEVLKDSFAGIHSKRVNASKGILGTIFHLIKYIDTKNTLS
ncbi:hypothetical protein [Lysinibacillus sp. RS5]|uniref:hypothetical protein n=1 Tax=unclassified Lysinibacillus TaxID=2636778 RepID=UPI0035BE6784